MTEFEPTFLAVFGLIAGVAFLHFLLTVIAYRRTARALRAIAINLDENLRQVERRASADQSAIANRFIVVDQRLVQMAAAIEEVNQEASSIRPMLDDRLPAIVSALGDAKLVADETRLELNNRVSALEESLSESIALVTQSQSDARIAYEKIRLRGEKRSDQHATMLKQLRQQLDASRDRDKGSRAHINKRLDQGHEASQKLLERLEQLRLAASTDREAWLKRLTRLDQRLAELSVRIKKAADDRMREALQRKQQEARDEIAGLKASLSAAAAQQDLLRSRLKEAHAGARAAQSELTFRRSKDGDAEEAVAFSRMRNGGGGEPG